MTHEYATAEQLLGVFQARLRQRSLGFADFESTADPVKKVATYLPGNPAAVRQLTAIGQRPDASLVALWQPAGLAASAERPVVYLSSDGMPNGLAANSLREFLSLLPYGTGFIISALEVYQDQKKTPGAGPEIAAALPVQTAREYWEYARQESPKQHKAFITWLRTAAGIEPAVNPAAVIEQALRTHPAFDEWWAAQQREK